MCFGTCSGWQQGGFEGAGSGAVARSQHLTREMVQSVVSFYEEGEREINSVRAMLLKMISSQCKYEAAFTLQHIPLIFIRLRLYIGLLFNLH